tara:strand:- start:575 stop:685 length:111 start_codon:yes stop_codon:yes gene_type:complete
MYDTASSLDKANTAIAEAEMMQRASDVVLFQASDDV